MNDEENNGHIPCWCGEEWVGEDHSIHMAGGMVHSRVFCGVPMTSLEGLMVTKLHRQIDEAVEFLRARAENETRGEVQSRLWRDAMEKARIKEYELRAENYTLRRELEVLRGDHE